MWTSPHRSALLAVCAQWIGPDYKFQKALLALPECRYSHSGEKQAELILETLEAFNIVDQVGYHTSDNASSNDTCLAHLESLLWKKYTIKFDAKQRRIRCIAHIINLSLQAFLLASSKEALQAALEAAANVSSKELIAQFSDILNSQQQKLHNDPNSSQGQHTRHNIRQRGSQSSQRPINDEFVGIQNIPALRKLHQLCVWLRESTLRANAWDDVVGLQLGIDNNTRWSSWYQVINRALKKTNSIKLFMLNHVHDLGDICFGNDDWDMLEKAHSFLEPFASATLYGEGQRASLSASLKLMDSLLIHYERNKAHYSQPQNYDPRMLRAIEMGWFVLNKYYTITEEAPVYAAALLLNPSCRVVYLKKNWPEQWHDSAIASAHSIWEVGYKNRDLPPTEHPSSSNVIPLPKKLGVVLDDLFESMEAITSDSEIEDDFMNFIQQPTFRIDCTPLEWWCQMERRERYPRLSQMAIDILSIPPESSEPERTFSGTRRTCSWDRSRLTCLNIQKIECVGNWLREGHIHPHSTSGMGLSMETIADNEEAEIDDEIVDEIDWI
jgi:hAT family C-terminal dimerisation region